MSTSLEVRLADELGQGGSYATMSPETLQAKLDNWEAKLQDGQIPRESDEFGLALNLLDRIGFALHDLSGGDLTQYVSYKQKYAVDKATQAV